MSRGYSEANASRRRPRARWPKNFPFIHCTRKEFAGDVTSTVPQTRWHAATALKELSIQPNFLEKTGRIGGWMPPMKVSCHDQGSAPPGSIRLRGAGPVLGKRRASLRLSGFPCAGRSRPRIQDGRRENEAAMEMNVIVFMADSKNLPAGSDFFYPQFRDRFAAAQTFRPCAAPAQGNQ